MGRRDTDFLALSSRVRAMETRLIGRSALERMIGAGTDAAALRVLEECGIQTTAIGDAASLSRSLNARLAADLAEFSGLCPESALTDFFRLRYDCHNAKALLRCSALGTDPDRLLCPGGTVDTALLKNAVFRREFGTLPEALGAALREAAELLNGAGDPQRCDLVLDRWYFFALVDCARRSGCKLLLSLARLRIDCANLKAAVRVGRTGRGRELLALALCEGGSVSVERILAAFEAGDPTGAFVSPLGAACAAAAAGEMTEMEAACDNAQNTLCRDAILVPFGDSVIAAYFAARETEIVNIQIVMAGRAAGLAPERIRERLRDSYV